MKLTVKLFATLHTHAPKGNRAGAPFEVDILDGSTIADLVAHLGIPDREVKIAYVDGRARSPHFRLEPGAEVGIFPPVGGG